MRDKEKQEIQSTEKKEPQSNQQPLSETIADAHAAGDGALERGKDSLMASDDGPASGDEKQPKDGAAY